MANIFKPFDLGRDFERAFQAAHARLTDKTVRRREALKRSYVEKNGGFAPDALLIGWKDIVREVGNISENTARRWTLHRNLPVSYIGATPVARKEDIKAWKDSIATTPPPQEEPNPFALNGRVCLWMRAPNGKKDKRQRPRAGQGLIMIPVRGGVLILQSAM